MLLDDTLCIVRARGVCHWRLSRLDNIYIIFQRCNCWQGNICQLWICIDHVKYNKWAMPWENQAYRISGQFWAVGTLRYRVGLIFFGQINSNPDFMLQFTPYKVYIFWKVFSWEIGKVLKSHPHSRGLDVRGEQVKIHAYCFQTELRLAKIIEKSSNLA